VNKVRDAGVKVDRGGEPQAAQPREGDLVVPLVRVVALAGEIDRAVHVSADRVGQLRLAEAQRLVPDVEHLVADQVPVLDRENNRAGDVPHMQERATATTFSVTVYDLPTKDTDICRQGCRPRSGPRSRGRCSSSARPTVSAGTAGRLTPVTPAHECDCSSLVQQAYRAAGISLPRTAAEQSRIGVLVRGPGELRPGDLLFVPGSAGTIANPGHVGMYIGDGLLVSAPRTGQVVHLLW
jgi:hypothetical protein